MSRNSALLWLPPIEKAGLPVPRTIIVPYDHFSAMGEIEGDDAEELPRLIDVVTAAAKEIGYPVFLRTDLSSAKHGGLEACSAKDESEITRATVLTIEDNEMKFWLEPHGPSAFMVREFIDLDSGFSAFGGLPIAREWRFFVRGGEPCCHHSYWPEDSVEFWEEEEPKGWREILADHHREPAEIEALQAQALLAAAACGGGFWSVDFAMDKTGKWWLLDMAHGADSWHWPDCPHAPTRSRP